MANIALEATLSSEFGDFGIDIDGNLVVLEKLIEICTNHRLQPLEVAAQWVSFACKLRSMHDFSVENIQDFDKFLSKPEASRKSKTPSRVVPQATSYNANSIRSIIKDEEEETDMLQSYASTPQSKGKVTAKRLHTTPEEFVNKRLSSLNRTPVAFSPASLSPAIITPTAKYEGRSSKGEVVATYGISQGTGITWMGSGKPASVAHYDSHCNVRSSYKYMFQKLQDKANVLNDVINTLADQIKDVLLVDDYESVAAQEQEEITVAGRICCDSVGRLNSKSVVLEGSRETSNGVRVPLDLSDLTNYSLFPGQIVAVQGKNPNGNRMHAKTIHPGHRLPFCSGTRKEMTLVESPFTVYTACGPFATCDDTLSYVPLHDLLGVVSEEKPDVLILMGPFVDIKQPSIEKAETSEDFESLFHHCYTSIVQAVRGTSTTVVLIPSQRDAFHDFVYPQPAFEVTQSSPQVLLMPDPCTLTINDVCFGITSTDVLFHLGAEEVSSFSVRSDRLGRLVEHLLRQQCYYPLHPTSEEINLDYAKFEEHAFMPVSPDVLLLPSDLRFFAKETQGCLAINPGRLVKGQTGGTYAKILVKPKRSSNSDWSSVVDSSLAQVLRI